MSGIVLALAGATTGPAPLPVIGSAYGGGFFAGQISTAGNGIADYNLVVGPNASALSTLQWKNVGTATTGADSVINGFQNTADIVADGNSTVYPAAHFCNDLVVGGFSDWYLPAKNEIEVCYFNLKPTTGANNTSYGINPNAVPPRASNYSGGSPASNPAQTSAIVFQTGNAEVYTRDSPILYWSSTEFSATAVSGMYFGDGGFRNYPKTSSYRARAIRRVAV